MAGCDPLRFTGVGTREFACLKAQGKAAGIPFDGDNGVATSMGVTVKWNYDATAQVLVLECTDAPRFVPCSAITNRLKGVVEGCLAGRG